MKVQKFECDAVWFLSKPVKKSETLKQFQLTIFETIFWRILYLICGQQHAKWVHYSEKSMGVAHGMEKVAEQFKFGVKKWMLCSVVSDDRLKNSKVRNTEKQCWELNFEPEF